MKKIWSERVRERRAALDLSQQEVADRIKSAGGKASQQVIFQLESHQGGKVWPHYALYLPDALETTMEYLTGETDNPARPARPSIKDLFPNDASNGGTHPGGGVGQEAPFMLTEISRMLGQMEGRMEARFDARFDKIDRKLEDHERRLEALEERPVSGPQKGRRR